MRDASQIFRQARRFPAGGLSPGKGNRRGMAENMAADRVRIICGYALHVEWGQKTRSDGAQRL